jgi:hypothetical protein
MTGIGVLGRGAFGVRRIPPLSTCQNAGIGPPGTPGQIDQPWGHVASPNLTSMWRAVEPAKESDIEAFWKYSGRVHATLQDVAKIAAAHLAAERGQPGLLLVESSLSPTLCRQKQRRLPSPTKPPRVTRWRATDFAAPRP